MGQFDFLEGNAPARTAPRRRSLSRVVTIQKTSKGLKGQQLAAWLTFIGGIALFSSMMPEPGSRMPPAGIAGGLVTIAGFFWILVNRWQRWWHHG